MPLRAGAPTFVPSQVMPQPKRLQKQRGDELIQQLADAMADTEESGGAVADTEVLAKKLPVAGLFCPYCSHGAACVFHGHGSAQQPRHVAKHEKAYRSPLAKDLFEAQCARPPPGLPFPVARGTNKVGFAPAPGLIPLPAGLFKTTATTDLDEWTDATSESRFSPRSTSSGISMASTSFVNASSNKIKGLTQQRGSAGRFRRPNAAAR